MRRHVNQKPAVPRLRNEVDATDKTDHSAKAPMGSVVTLIAGLYVLCCGLLLPLLTSVSLATIFQSRPVTGAIVALLVSAGLIWGARKDRAIRSSNPKRVRSSGARVENESEAAG